MFKKILVPLDGSHLAEMAIPYALELASRFEAEITLLRVVQPPQLIMADVSGGVYAELLVEMRKQAENEARTYLKGLQGELRQQGYTVHAHLAEGEPVAEVILEVADGLDIDTIVMSTHGRSGLSRWVYGSVADKVLRQARVPVVLIRAGTQAEEPHVEKSNVEEAKEKTAVS
ncbi:MAG: universal stress protein [Chloroflexi bacterium]|nr:MAG: universal stress protein [Chloroflexota bacterium]